MFLSIILPFSCADLSSLEDDFDIQYQAWCAANKNISVANIYDGDTFDYFENDLAQKIRMLGVAAPEVESTTRPAECYGQKSADFLTSVIADSEVRLEFDVECEDIYDRTLAWVILRGDDSQIAEMMESNSMLGLNSDGSYELLVNELMVRMGYAKVFQGEVDQSIRYKSQMETAEQAAEDEEKGLWNECN